jgi:hypothetical protein
MKTLKIIAVTAFLALGTITFSQAQTKIEITLSPEQEIALAAAVAVINPDRALQDPPGVQVTVATYAAELFQSTLVSIVREWKSRITSEVLAKYEAANEKTKEDAVKVLEGKASITDKAVVGEEAVEP